VEDLFQGIIKGEPQLNPVIHIKLKKLLKGATKAIANAKIQHSQNAELIAAKETQKRCNKRSKKNYGFARVMDAELIEERETEYKAQTFEEARKDLYKIKPWVQAKKKKSSQSKRKPRKADHRVQLTVFGKAYARVIFRCASVTIS